MTMSVFSANGFGKEPALQALSLLKTGLGRLPSVLFSNQPVDDPRARSIAAASANNSSASVVVGSKMINLRTMASIASEITVRT